MKKAKSEKRKAKSKGYKLEIAFLLLLTAYSLQLTALSGCAKKEQAPKPKAQEAVQISSDAKIAYAQGIKLYNATRYQEALAAFKRAVERDPKSYEAWCEYAVTLMELNRFDEAISPLKKAIELNPNYPKAHYVLAVAYVRKKTPDTKSARRSYERAVKLGYRVPEWFVRYVESVERKAKN